MLIILCNHVNSTMSFQIISFMCYRKLPLPFECLLCLTCTLTPLARTLPLTLLVYLARQGQACWVTLQAVLILPWCHWWSIPLMYRISLSCALTCMCQRNSSMLLNRPREHITGSSPISPFFFCHFSELIGIWWLWLKP